MPHRLIALFAAILLLPACTPQAPIRPLPTQTTQPAVRPSQAPAPTAAPVPEQPAAAVPGIADRADVRAFVAEMSRKHGFSSTELLRAFDQAAIDESILAAMAKPYEAKPWYAYRKLFLTEKRIGGGRDFKGSNAAALAAAEARYRVSPDIITAIIGIESSYGQRPGKHRVIDSLSTLAFGYPKRAQFFRSELEQFLLLCREEDMDFLGPVGSYAGAMGMPQFMPSSYRKLAADGDGDGKRDIWNNPADAIASVARYFSASGWHRGEPIAVPASVRGNAYRGLVAKTPKPSQSLARLAELGIEPERPVSGALKGALVELPGETGPLHWIVFHNFSVIMRYNHSPLYAMAAYELSRELAAGGD